MNTDQEGTGAAVSGMVSFGCPNCGWTGEFDHRFTAWCEGCGFNADTSKAEPEKRRAARRRTRVRVRAERQCGRLLAAADLRPTSATGVAVTVAAAVVHLMTLTVLAGSIVLIAFGSRFWFSWPLGLLGIALAMLSRQSRRSS